jgi:hypothetical protein
LVSCGAHDITQTIFSWRLVPAAEICDIAITHPAAAHSSNHSAIHDATVTLGGAASSCESGVQSLLFAEHAFVEGQREGSSIEGLGTIRGIGIGRSALAGSPVDGAACRRSNSAFKTASNWPVRHEVGLDSATEETGGTR